MKNNYFPRVAIVASALILAVGLGGCLSNNRAMSVVTKEPMRTICENTSTAGLIEVMDLAGNKLFLGKNYSHPTKGHREEATFEQSQAYLKSN